MAPIDRLVIVARDRYELTDSCLRHLAARPLDHRVILVDNGSRTARPSACARWPA